MTQSTGGGPGIPCEGWWQQDSFGRQEMTDLRLWFESGKVLGSGNDIVGPFTFAGTLSTGGQVRMRKQYVGQHSVDYLGTYDGEGILWGEWRIGPCKDRWLIKISGSRAASAQLETELPIETLPPQPLNAH